MSPLLLIFTIFSLLSLTRPEERAHGLANESPMAISPEAYAFFHPAAALQPSTSNACGSSSKCSSLLIAAAGVQSTPGHESVSTGGGRGLRAGSIAGISLGLVFACIMGVTVYLVVIRRRANLRSAKPEQVVQV